MGPTLLLTLAMALPGGGGHGCACNSAHSCQACDCCCGHGCLIGCGFWTRHGLPRPFHAPGNMHQRHPYDNDQTYYYFRPYNYVNIPVQQAEAISFGAPQGLPYSNQMFQQVYRAFELQGVEEVKPIFEDPAPPAPPEAAPPIIP